MLLPKKPRVKSRQNMIDYGIEFPYCQVCGFQAVDVHHIISKGKQGDDLPENFISLCRDHHLKAHKDMSNTQWLYNCK